VVGHDGCGFYLRREHGDGSDPTVGHWPVLTKWEPADAERT
jgi:hypothetical protein